MALNVWYSDGPRMPQLDPAAAAELAGLPTTDGLDVTVAWVLEPLPWFAERGWAGEVRVLMPGQGASRAVRDGHLTAAPTPISAIPDLIRRTRVDLAVIEGALTPRGITHGTAVGAADVLAAHADRVVVEVDENATDLGAPLIDGNIVATVRRPAERARAMAATDGDERLDAIGRLVASVVPEGATLQLGIGGVLDSVAANIDRPMHMTTGVVTDAAAALLTRGLLLTPVVTAYTMGAQAIDALARAQMLSLRSITVTHDVERYAAIDRFVSCNTALEVGLDGSVNVERVGGRVVAGVGGHRDFCRAATLSPDGFSIIAVRADAKGTSRIVPMVEHVSTPSANVSMVVTEHGIADLRGATAAQRAERLIAVAAPEHRDALRSSI